MSRNGCAYDARELLKQADLLADALDSMTARHCTRRRKREPQLVQVPEDLAAVVCAACRTLAQVLRLAPSGMPTQLFLLQLLERMPQSPFAGVDVQKLLKSLRDCNPPALLVRDCSTAAEVLEIIAYGERSPPGVAAGPSRRRRHWTDFPFSDQQTLLLETLDGKGYVPRVEVIKSVYAAAFGTVPLNKLEGRLSKLKTDTNDSLERWQVIPERVCWKRIDHTLCFYYEVP
jgi:hypothetical protein